MTGLTSNPTIFDHAIKSSAAYDPTIRSKLKQGKSGEALFFELAIEDITQAADLFRPVYERTCGVDGWVSLEVSPLLAYDTKTTIDVAKAAARARGTPQPVHQDPRHQGRIARDRRGDLRRRAGQRDAAVLAASTTWRPPKPTCAASSGASQRGSSPTSARSHRCSSAAGTWRSRARCPMALTNRLGIAIGQRTYKAYRELIGSARWQRAFNVGARPQRLLLGEHRDQGSEGLRHPVHQGAGRAVHRQHDARRDVEGVRRPRRGRRAHAARRRRLRGGAGAVRQGRHRHRCAGGAAAGGGRRSRSSSRGTS